MKSKDQLYRGIAEDSTLAFICAGCLAIVALTISCSTLNPEQARISVMASEPDAEIIIDDVLAGYGKVDTMIDRRKDTSIRVQKDGFYPEERTINPVRSNEDLAKKNIVICLYAERVPTQDYSHAGMNTWNRQPPSDAPTCAILAFDVKSESPTDLQSILADRFKVEVGRMGKYRIVDRARMTDILSERNFSHSNQVRQGAVEVGNLLGVQYVIYGSAAKVGSLYTANVYLVSVETGAQVASATVDVEGEFEDLLVTGMAEAASKLLHKEVLPNNVVE